MTRPTIGQVPDLPELSLQFTTPLGVEVWGFSSSGLESTLGWWHRLRDVHADTGLWPVVMYPSDADNLRQEYDMPRTREKFAKAHDDRDDADLLAEMFDLPDEHATTKAGRWPRSPERYRHWIPASIPTQVTLVPADGGWDVPVVVGFGNFNNCPHPSWHRAALRYWYQRHGAELCAMSHASLEFIVTRPPTTREKAVELAREHWAYGNEAIETQTLAEQGAILLNATMWQAWWD